MSEPVVLSAAAADRPWLDRLQQHLKAYRDRGLVQPWEQRDIPAGARVHDAVAEAFDRARAVVLLVSPQFLADEFAPEGELFPRVIMALERGVPVLWLPLSYSAYQTTELREFKALYDPERPLDGMSGAEVARALVDVCEQIVAAVGRAPATPGRPPGTSGPSRAPAAVRSDPEQLFEQQLDEARARRERLAAIGEDTAAVTEEIRALRRQMRNGRPLHPGDVLADERYVLLAELGSGGFATVWRAVDQTTGDAVAVKVLHAQHNRSAERRERFFRGARIMAQLDHPAIVPILDPHVDDGDHHFFVMRYIAGGTLRDAVLTRGMPREQRIDVILRIADALAHAHVRGIVHRDIKPGNILIADDGAAYLTDFDLVRAEDTTGGTGGGLGTVIYAAPEMMERAGEADARADVYALGMTLVFVLLERDLTMSVLRDADRLIDGLPISEAMRMVLRTAIAWNREHRFASATEFRAALAAAQRQTGVRGKFSSSPEHLRVRRTTGELPRPVRPPTEPPAPAPDPPDPRPASTPAATDAAPDLLEETDLATPSTTAPPTTTAHEYADELLPAPGSSPVEPPSEPGPARPAPPASVAPSLASRFAAIADESRRAAAPQSSDFHVSLDPDNVALQDLSTRPLPPLRAHERTELDASDRARRILRLAVLFILTILLAFLAVSWMRSA